MSFCSNKTKIVKCSALLNSVNCSSKSEGGEGTLEFEANCSKVSESGQETPELVAVFEVRGILGSTVPLALSLAIYWI